MSFGHSFFNFDINVWVFVNVFNNEKELDACFDSILKQTYKLLNILVIDDCSNDSSLSIIDKWATESFVLEKNEQTVGPAVCKLRAFEYVKKHASANDILIELAADGVFLKESAIEDLVISSVWNKAWFVYGPVFGHPCYAVSDVNFNSYYYYGLNVFLCDKFSFEDFSGYETDREYCSKFVIRKCLDLCGQRRSYFHPVSLIKRGVFLKSDDIKPLVMRSELLLSDAVHILINVYHKQYNLPNILKSIDSTIDSTIIKEVFVHVINNNKERIIETCSINKLSFQNIKLIIFNSSVNREYFSYLTYIRGFLKSFPSSYAIVLDDENLVPTKWIEDTIEFCSPLTYSCGVGLVFNNITKLNEVTFSAFKKNFESDVFDYGKIEGSVLDMNLALSSSLFKIDFTLLPFIEDLWLSFICKQVFGKEIININKRLDFTASPVTVDNLYKGWITKEKVEILPKLVRAGYLKSSHLNILKLPALFSGLNKEVTDICLAPPVLKSLSESITLVVMNCHRSDTLKNVILPFYDLTCSHLINQIIVYHAKKETMFEYLPISKNIEVNNIYNEEDEKRYALFNRFIQPAKFSKNECILIIDDDVVPDVDRILATYNSWSKAKMNVHGSSGRFCSNGPDFKYIYKHNDTKRVPIILTSFVMASLTMIKYCISQEHKVYKLTSNYKPKWNGEDIFLSLCAYNLTKEHNFVVNSKNKMAVFKRDNFAISGDSSHIKCRTELCNKICEIYGLNKRDTLTNYKYMI